MIKDLDVETRAKVFINMALEGVLKYDENRSLDASFSWENSREGLDYWIEASKREKIMGYINNEDLTDGEVLDKIYNLCNSKN